MGFRLTTLKKVLKIEHGIDLDAIAEERKALRVALLNITQLTSDLEYYPAGETPFSAARKTAQEVLDKYI